jgi:hypothetical protein
MSNGNPSSAPSSERTSPREPVRDAPVSEASYLAGQEANAKAALQQTLDDLTRNLKVAGDPCLWTKRYPWLSVGIATAAGFVAARAVAPSRKRAGAPAQSPPASTPESSPRPQSLFTDGKLSSLIWDLLRTALLGYVATAVQPAKKESEIGS